MTSVASYALKYSIVVLQTQRMQNFDLDTLLDMSALTALRSAAEVFWYRRNDRGVEDHRRPRLSGFTVAKQKGLQASQRQGPAIQAAIRYANNPRTGNRLDQE